MDKYETLKGYKDGKFRRITGVKREPFDEMVTILRVAYMAKHRRRGRKAKLSIEDMLLATLEYLREYRTYAHIAASYGIHESNACRTIHWVENILIKDGTFALPGRKILLKDDSEYFFLLIDATESPIERPKKTTPVLFREEKETRHKNISRG
jgi:hypothetical protein